MHCGEVGGAGAFLKVLLYGVFLPGEEVNGIVGKNAFSKHAKTVT